MTNMPNSTSEENERSLDIPRNSFDGLLSDSLEEPLLSPQIEEEIELRNTATSRSKSRLVLAVVCLVISLLGFAVETETARYIQIELKWSKAYCMLYVGHSSWALVWPMQLLFIRATNWRARWSTLWRQHKQSMTDIARTILQLDNGPPAAKSPWPGMLRIGLILTFVQTVASCSWFIAVRITTASDLTAISNCSVFFAYGFSVLLLNERFQTAKAATVVMAISGVLIIAYGPQALGQDVGNNGKTPHRLAGDVIMLAGSVGYGYYQVLYKKLACPPDTCSPHRATLFANTTAGLVGFITMTIFWIPLPILHITGIEEFVFPRGDILLALTIFALCNAILIGSMFILISLTDPVVSSLSHLLSIILIAVLDEFLPPPFHSPLTLLTVLGGFLIIAAFAIHSWVDYRQVSVG